MTSTEPGEDSDLATRYNLINELRNLPWAGQLDLLPPPWDSGNDGLFIALATEWLSQYSQMLRAIKATALANQTELYDLRYQRDAVRAFLGTHQEGTT